MHSLKWSGSKLRRGLHIEWWNDLDSSRQWCRLLVAKQIICTREPAASFQIRRVQDADWLKRSELCLFIAFQPGIILTLKFELENTQKLQNLLSSKLGGSPSGLYRVYKQVFGIHINQSQFSETKIVFSWISIFSMITLWIYLYKTKPELHTHTFAGCWGHYEPESLVDQHSS